MTPNTNTNGDSKMKYCATQTRHFCGPKAIKTDILDPDGNGYSDLLIFESYKSAKAYKKECEEGFYYLAHNESGALT